MAALAEKAMARHSVFSVFYPSPTGAALETVRAKDLTALYDNT